MHAMTGDENEAVNAKEGRRDMWAVTKGREGKEKRYGYVIIISKIINIF